MKRNDFLKVDMKSDKVCIFIPMMLLTNVCVSIYNGHIQMFLPTLGLEHWLHLLQFLGVSRLFTVMLSVSTLGYWNNFKCKM